MRVHYGIIFFLMRRVKKASRFIVPFLKVEFPLSFQIGQQSEIMMMMMTSKYCILPSLCNGGGDYYCTRTQWGWLPSDDTIRDHIVIER